jgi:hypothetical protein
VALIATNSFFVIASLAKIVKKWSGGQYGLVANLSRIDVGTGFLTQYKGKSRTVEQALGSN